MTTAVYKQNAAAVTYLVQGCSSVALPSPNIVGGHYAAHGGSSSGTQHTRTITGSNTYASSRVILALWHSLSFPDGDYWEAGDWICRLNVSQYNRDIVWKTIDICAQRGGVWTTIASKTDVNAFLSSNGTVSVTLTTGSPSDFRSVPGQTIYWIYGFEKTTTAEQTFKYKSNKNLATPIVAKAFVPTATFDSASIAPAATPQTLTVSAPLATFDTAAVAPAATPGTQTVPVPLATFDSAAVAPTADPQVATVPVPLATFYTAAIAPAIAAQTLTVPMPVSALSATAFAPGVLAPAFITHLHRANVATGVAARSNAQAGEAASISIPAAATSRHNAAYAYSALSTVSPGVAQRAVISAAHPQANRSAASYHERLAVASGEAVRANASIAMESRFALASGGPEAFSLGQG